MTCNDIIQILEELAPSRFACDWDNVGLLVGRRGKEVSCIGVALEVGDDVLTRCREEKVDMLITYHPVLFQRISRINDDAYRGRWLLQMIQEDLSCFALHTNLDVAPGGMSDIAAKAIGLVTEKPLLVSLVRGEDQYGRGRVGHLEEPMTIQEMKELVESLVPEETPVLYSKWEDRPAGRIAVCTGTGRELIVRAEEEECDVLICGDVGERAGNEAVKCGVSVIDVGPYGLEPLMVPRLGAFLREKLGESVKVVELAPCNSRKSC